MGAYRENCTNILICMITLSHWIHISCFNFREKCELDYDHCLYLQSSEKNCQNSSTKVSRFSNESSNALKAVRKGGTQERRRVWSKVPCAMLCLCVCCRALSDCVYFPEGRFTSGSLGMNGELISPTETSQSLHIYSPPLQ